MASVVACVRRRARLEHCLARGGQRIDRVGTRATGRAWNAEPAVCFHVAHVVDFVDFNRIRAVQVFYGLKVPVVGGRAVHGNDASADAARAERDWRPGDCCRGAASGRGRWARRERGRWRRGQRRGGRRRARAGRRIEWRGGWRTGGRGRRVKRRGWRNERGWRRRVVRHDGNMAVLDQEPALAQAQLIPVCIVV